MINPTEGATMSNEIEQSITIDTVGDPDAPLSVATMILAAQRLRMSGAPGGIEYRLHVQQAHDIETDLVNMDGTPGFRNTPVYASVLTRGGYVVAPDSGARVAILSAYVRDPFGARLRDPRAADMTAEQVSALKAKAERQRLAMRSTVEVAIDEIKARLDEAGIP